MDSNMINSLVMLVGASAAAVVGIIGGISSCMMKSRCTNIKSPCLSCDRDVMDEDNAVYNTPIEP